MVGRRGQGSGASCSARPGTAPNASAEAAQEHLTLRSGFSAMLSLQGLPCKMAQLTSWRPLWPLTFTNNGVCAPSTAHLSPARWILMAHLCL